ncbi:beta-ketoacyl-[acyl-carrier-protein] synthase family protein [Roseicitreum antarcticum]|uniref:Nodulation protein E n=1 Tax=Roseicitreum antarcticum TaxID=564137 RepID=A0A1H2TVM5_9RHOB|nr:beta-ketoacyl-[acyl-carrier-protein] synthase family protein [Roseicitreum antarcticum]SDW48036.1 nodulation protein E [Roseicitreum antarcticum]
MRRVVITGAGTVNPLGQGVAETFAAMAAGQCGIGPLDFRDVERLIVQIGAMVKDWDAEARFDRSQLAMYDRSTQFALEAARQAVAQSGLDFAALPDLAARAGVIMGTAGGGLTTSDDSYRAIYEERKARVHPFIVPKLMHNAAASHISMTYGVQGPVFTVSTACASSNHAMGLAFQMVRSGAVPVMLTGGAESMMCFGGLKAWEGLRVMSRTGCRPFSADRDGMVQGEGAGVVVMEDREHAIARGAPILAEVLGFAMTSDASDIVMPSVDGAVRAMAGALRDGGIAPERVGYINAHGTGTQANDRSEAAAIGQVFGATPPRVSSTKAMHGHLIGAAGAVELMACLMALQDGIIAPTVNHTGPDPDCALDVVPNAAVLADLDVVMTNSFAFGGLNAVLALGRDAG